MQLSASSSAPGPWNDYVARHPDATAYHRSEAVAIGRDAFGLRTHYLTATADSRIVGVLPLVEQSSVLFGRFLSSLPFVTYGGVLADDDDCARLLAEKAGELARSRRAKHVELRHGRPMASLGLAERLDKVSMVLDLPGDEDALAASLGSKLRSQIRRAQREEPEIAWGRTELVAEFFEVFAPAMQALGTPVYPKSFFATVLDAMGERASLLVVRVAGKPEGAAVVVRHGRSIEVPWAAATLWGKRNAINMRMYWEMLTRAIAEGCAAFDFGRSTVDSGTYRFKAQWGATPRQLHWHYWLPPGAEIPVLNHSNAKYALAIRAWQAMPLWCANLLGPRISRYLP